MSELSQNYITLSYVEEATASEVPNKLNEYSWRIVFNKAQDCFLCQNMSTTKVTKIKNIEEFIKAWIDFMCSKANDMYVKAEINLFLQDVHFSGFQCFGNPKQVTLEDTAFNFSSILKNIQE